MCALDFVNGQKLGLRGVMGIVRLSDCINERAIACIREDK